ncbi:hypothetical protein [Chitinophaga deserti]|uniref:hypothetical protein n=1 Tax=Chitinophaga deserti TaxID=2164099 RepID=UPI000D6D226F|nr:hypothetical protein [Chitinophaga deserti]
MKRSFAILGLCLALGIGITSSIKASGKKAAKICCDQNHSVCFRIDPTTAVYGPSVIPPKTCPDL